MMRVAFRLAKQGYGSTSPNPMVGAVLVKRGRIIGRGWHKHAGEPHAEINAIADSRRHGADPAGATLYVTLEPCSTYGRTPPCTDAIKSAGIQRVVVAATDPNPKHCGQGLSLLRDAGIKVITGVLDAEATELNAAFNHWIVHGTPFVTVKAAMSLDGKIATATGDAKWITGPAARRLGMKLRLGADAILVGVNTVLADDPSLTVRDIPGAAQKLRCNPLRRIILDSRARTPLAARVVSDKWRGLTTVVVTRAAPRARIVALSKLVHV